MQRIDEANFATILNSNIEAYLCHDEYDENTHIKLLCDLILSREIEVDNEEIKKLFTEIQALFSKNNIYSLKYILLDNLRLIWLKRHELPVAFNHRFDEATMFMWGYELKLTMVRSLDLFWKNLEYMSPEKWNVFYETLRISGITALSVPGNDITGNQYEMLLDIIRQNNIRRCLLSEHSLTKYIFYSMFRHEPVGLAIAQADPQMLPSELRMPTLIDNIKEEFPELPGLTGMCNTLSF